MESFVKLLCFQVEAIYPHLWYILILKQIQVTGLATWITDSDFFFFFF